MKKNAILLAAAWILLGTVGSFAAGIGVQYNANAGDIYTNGIALNLKLDDKPVVFALSYYLGDEKTLGLTADYWLFDNRISALGNSDINWFAGVGAFLSTRFTGDDKGVKGGVRIPLGVNMLIDKKIEPFFQVAPSIGLKFSPSINATHVYFPITVGFRIWF
ncbi:MAG TPA: DUF3996 domain-containing protein [bacterium]|nr:DUF3996 domain-containing protein [bacterium]HPR89426.1 DUF3996 domain-containing protein [bacterium]